MNFQLKKKERWKDVDIGIYYTNDNVLCETFSMGDKGGMEY